MPEYLISQIDDDIQALRVDHSPRFIQNDSVDWQFLFGPNSELVSNILVLKNTGQFNTNTFDSIKVIGYLYNSSNGTVGEAASCVFNIYQVSTTGWTESLLGTFNGIEQSNSYWLSNINLSSLTPANLDGDSSLMIECIITRLSKTFRDRIYLNHLGSYDSIVRLRNDVEFLDITKLDE